MTLKRAQWVVDSVWDAIHTCIRVPAGAAVAASAFAHFDLKVRIIAMLLGGGIALTSPWQGRERKRRRHVVGDPISDKDGNRPGDTFRPPRAADERFADYGA